MKHTHKKEERRGAVICGAYGRGNAGDDAILRAIMQEMRQLDETMPMRVISRNPTETSRRFGVSACHTFHFICLFNYIAHKISSLPFIVYKICAL